ncbi:MAG: DUF2267 domain-containing protein [Anaerolineales bacterium]
MEYQDFINKVEEQEGVGGRAEAERLTEIVLSRLALRLSRAERSDTAGELPDQLKVYFDSGEEREILPYREFVNRVNSDYPGAYTETEVRIRAVLVALREAISEGQFRDILEDLPVEYGLAFSGG